MKIIFSLLIALFSLGNIANAQEQKRPDPQPAPETTETFKLGIAGYTFHKFDLDKTLETLKTTDVHYLCIKDFHLPFNSTDQQIKDFHNKLKSKGVTGYAARSFRHFYDNTDQVIKTELLATDYYRPANKIIFKGPSVEMPANGQPEGENELDDVLPNDSETESQSSIEEDNVPPAEEDD